MTSCNYCGKEAELRMGCCWECGTSGEARAARRTVWQHLWTGAKHAVQGSANARFDFQWAWERLTRSGDYAPGGEFSEYL